MAEKADSKGKRPIVIKKKSAKPPSLDNLRKQLDPNIGGSPYNLPIVTDDGINSFPGWCLDYHYALLSVSELTPLALPALLGGRANAVFQPQTEILIRDIRSTTTVANADLLLLRDNRNIRYMQNNQSVHAFPIAPPTPVWWYDAPFFNVAAKGKWQLNVELANGTAVAHDTYFAFPSLLKHKYGPLVDGAFRKTLIQKSMPFFLEQTFSFAAGDEIKQFTVEINRQCIFVGGFFIGDSAMYLMEAYSGRDSNSAGLTAKGNPVPVELVLSGTLLPIKLTWPGCYYIGANDAFVVSIRRYSGLAAPSELTVQFQGFQW